LGSLGAQVLGKEGLGRERFEPAAGVSRITENRLSERFLLSAHFT
jgi:hypothetical protein